MGVEIAAGITLGEVAAVVGTVASVAGGIQQANEAERQARAAQEESELTARNEARENIAFEKRQKLAFLKSGVALAGTPLAVLAETERKGQANVETILRGGRTRARAARQAGRAALISGFAQGAKGVGSLNSNSGGSNPNRDLDGNPLPPPSPPR